MSAGPDEVRRPESLSDLRASSSCLTTGCFWFSVATVSFIAFQCACQASNCDLCNCSVDMLAGRAASLRLREYFGAEDFAGPHYRPDDPGAFVRPRHRHAGRRSFPLPNFSARKISPVLIIAQMIRASLLARATVTRRAGFFARSALIQSASALLRLLTLRSSEVAERTSSFLM